MPDMTQLFTGADKFAQTCEKFATACAQWDTLNQQPVSHQIAPRPEPPERSYTCGYFGTKYDHKRFSTLVKRLYSSLSQVLEESRADTIVVHGTSGTSVGFAMQMLGHVPLVMLRKPDGSHGPRIEGNVREFRSYVFLDDFIGTGDTVRRVMATLTRAECMGVWLHSGALNVPSQLTTGPFYTLGLPAWRYE